MKIVSPQILHKTEAGGVVVGVRNAEQAAEAFAGIVANARRYDPKASIDGVQVQQMLSGGQEVIIGAVTDPAFGKLVAFGLGGILAAEILRGVRGTEPVDREALAGMIENVSRLVADFPEISELDLNPVFASPTGAIAADVRIVLDFTPPAPRYRPSQQAIVRQMNRPAWTTGSERHAGSDGLPAAFKRAHGGGFPQPPSWGSRARSIV
jgi:acyl-CoA synthetase (NDP forming)